MGHGQGDLRLIATETRDVRRKRGAHPSGDRVSRPLRWRSRNTASGSSRPTRKRTRPPILDSVSFEIEQGSFTLILGRSGSGQEHVVAQPGRHLPRLLRGRNKGRAMVFDPERGFVNRRDLEDSERFKLVNMLFQNPEDQIVTLSVEEEIAFALENYQFPPDEIHRRIDRALDLVGIAGFRERSTLKLSGGEKQRVALASMLALEPRVLILDEPTSNLDPLGTEEVLAAVDRVRERSDLTLMVVEHEVDVVFQRADSVLLVEEHEVKGPYDPRQFLDDHGLHIRDDLGLWIPQTVEVALQLRSAGIDLPTMPLTADELVESLGGLVSEHSTPASTNGEPEPTTPSGEPAIEVRGARFSYGEHEVLSGVDLVIRRNELLAVLGQNGSGKSTLAALLNGILQPTGGEVIVEGKATTDYKFSHLVKRVAYIFQVPEKQFIRNSVYEEIAHGLLALGLPDDEVERRTVEYLEQVRLLDRRGASPYVLSHGQKRRLSVACMVVSRPDVVVLDEPTFRAGLPPGVQPDVHAARVGRRGGGCRLHHPRHAVGRRVRRPMCGAQRRRDDLRRAPGRPIWRSGHPRTGPAQGPRDPRRISETPR